MLLSEYDEELAPCIMWTGVELLRARIPGTFVAIVRFLETLFG